MPVRGGREACRFRARTGGDSRGTGVRRGEFRRTLLKAGKPQDTPMIAQPRS
jgi:hypothetical protein